jgi:hypothetical protein
MKYVCRAYANGKECDEAHCKHNKPHEWVNLDKIGDLGSDCYDYTNTRCDCVPIGLEYYMKEIIKKHEEKSR